MSSNPVIVADNASKLFLDGAVVAFRQLSFAINRNEIMCIVGPSGCGKTTFLRCIAGLTDISTGQLLVDGKPVSGPPDGVAMVFQHFGLLPWKTVYENAAFGLAMANTPADKIKERVNHYLELVGLSGFEKHYPYQLSGGMQQRVGLVRALAMNPSVLLMDEPFAALDEQTRMLLGEKLLEICQTLSQTALLITHNLSEAITLSDRVLLMSFRPGRIKRIVEIDLPRPRSSEIIASSEFGRYVGLLWQDLREEASRGMAETERTSA